MEVVKQRNNRVDNIKAILIFLVVFGHMLELASARRIYLIIYSFHMPAFIFVTGYYAKFKPRKILLELIMPYILFQTLYLLFDGYINGEAVTLQYTKPYWLMWYLLTIIIYYLLLPLIRTDNKKQRLLIFILSVAISLLAGYDTSIGYYMSLSRTLVFLPFFVLGNYIGNGWPCKIVFEKWYQKAAILFGIVISSYYILTAEVSSAMLYGSYSYEGAGFGLMKRAVLLIIAWVWILALFSFVPNTEIPVFRVWGKGTFSVFLIHGFIQRLIGKGDFFDSTSRSKYISAAFVSVLVVMLFGNRYVSKAFDYVARGRALRENKDRSTARMAFCTKKTT